MPLSRRKKRHLKLWSVLLVLGVLFAFGLVRFDRLRSPLLGVTFSHVYAQDLGLDWREAYAAILADLSPDHMRIPVYWSHLEPERGGFIFDDYDWMLNEAARRGVAVTLAIGQKVPRWPECYLPQWVDALQEDGQAGDEAREAAVLSMIEAFVKRYEAHPAVGRWQVENEPFLAFGVCPKTDLGFVRRELELVRSISQKPIAMTTSGELEPWFQVAPFADQVGFSLYRLTWNPIFGYWAYPFQPNIYRARVKTLEPFVDAVYISELQAEPWFHAPIESLSIDDQHRMFSPRMLRENVAFARRIEVPLVDLWGAEWWWYMKVNGDDSLWEEAKKVFQ
ncbi:TPA: hypothetical protein DDZ10_02730 [Candidatus Uhrbacteria bacterium]|nr:MAG: hypothetical protein A3D69_01005 [Candidatus Uhrbacteria bacterium RIFCSPHIGHO2_02_FULL_54_11]HBL39564.1 hypothetical protein [Candidatus Uhrbacteria bacterium]